MRIQTIERIFPGTPRQESRFSVMLSTGYVLDVDRSLLFTRRAFMNLVRTHTHEQLEDPTLGSGTADDDWRKYIGKFLVDETESAPMRKVVDERPVSSTLEVVVIDGDYQLVDGGRANEGDVVATITTAPGISDRMLRNLFLNVEAYKFHETSREPVAA